MPDFWSRAELKRQSVWAEREPFLDFGLICILLNIDSVNISYTDLEGEIITRIRVNVSELQPNKVVELVRKNVASLVSEYGRQKILGIGVAVTGMVLEDSRFVASASLKWKEFDLKAIFEKETGIPVFVENFSLLKDLEIREINVTEENTLKGAAFNLCDRLFDIEYTGNIVE